MTARPSQGWSKGAPKESQSRGPTEWNPITCWVKKKDLKTLRAKGNTTLVLIRCVASSALLTSNSTNWPITAIIGRAPPQGISRGKDRGRNPQVDPLLGSYGNDPYYCLSIRQPLLWIGVLRLQPAGRPVAGKLRLSLRQPLSWITARNPRVDPLRRVGRLNSIEMMTTAAIIYSCCVDYHYAQCMLLHLSEWGCFAFGLNRGLIHGLRLIQLLVLRKYYWCYLLFVTSIVVCNYACIM